MRSWLGPYLACKLLMVGSTRAQNGHCRSENSTIVTGATGEPHTGSSLTGKASALACTPPVPVASFAAGDEPGLGVAGATGAPAGWLAQLTTWATTRSALVKRAKR